jgi:carboxyl-terminal processing protease
MQARLGVSRTTLGKRRVKGEVKARICNELGEWLYQPPEGLPSRSPPPPETAGQTPEAELPVTRDDIGVFWKHVGGEWFVAGVYAGGPAAKGGLKVGDRVLAAEGRPFSPVQSLAGKAGKPVALQVKRARDGAPLALEVTPRATRPQEEFRQASAESFRILDHRGKRIAYVHVWAWTSTETQQALLEMIARANAQSVDGFILDLRDGWGGAATHYLSVFFRDAPVLESINREGKSQAFDYQIRKPAVLLINGGTRSGKETIAYGAKKHGLARLVGERTAGAVTFGQPFCLSDGSLLLLAVADARVDGERLEGRGVSPDIEVPFDIRYADGRDPQLDRALEVLSGDAASKP